MENEIKFSYLDFAVYHYFAHFRMGNSDIATLLRIPREEVDARRLRVLNKIEKFILKGK